VWWAVEHCCGRGECQLVGEEGEEVASRRADRRRVVAPRREGRHHPPWKRMEGHRRGAGMGERGSAPSSHVGRREVQWRPRERGATTEEGGATHVMEAQIGQGWGEGRMQDL
jgi:hypothetical protein